MNKLAKVDLNIEEADDFTYSAVLRLLRTKLTTKQAAAFQKIFKIYFDAAVLSEQEEFNEKIVLLKTLIKLKEAIDFNIPNKFIKNASAIEMGNAQEAGKNLAAIIKFLMKRISVENRSKSTISLRDKIMKLDPYSISSKKTPPSAAMGQSIMFLKNVLVGHTADYVAEVIRSIVTELSDTNSADDINSADIVDNVREPDTAEPTAIRPYYVAMDSDIAVAPASRAIDGGNYTDSPGDNQYNDRDKNALKNTKPVKTDVPQAGQLTNFLDFWYGGGPSMTGGGII